MVSFTASSEERGDYQMSHRQTKASRVIALGLVLIFWCSLLLLILTLLGAIDMSEWIKATGKKARIFALVHDSILAEVPDEEVEEYMEQLAKFIQMDRGISIPGAPVGCDFEIVHEDYSGGKFEKKVW